MYTLSKDFNGKGGFHVYWTELWAKLEKFCPQIGRRSNKAQFDPKEDVKLRFHANPPFDPVNSAEDAMHLLYMAITKIFAIRGKTEVSFYPNP